MTSMKLKLREFRILIGLILGLLFFITSCNSQNSRKVSKEIVNFTVELVKTGELKFQLDSITAPYSEAFSYIYNEEKQESYLYFFNRRFNRIYVYNCKLGEIHDIITYQKDGPDGVGIVEGLHVKSPDSIFVLDKWTSKLSLIDKLGKQVNSWIVNDISHFSEDNLIPRTLSMGNDNPLVINEGSFYLTGFTIGEWKSENENNRFVALRHQINTGETEYLLSYPPIYKDGNWGGYNYRVVYSCFNEKDGNLVLSFPADVNVTNYNLNTGKKDIYYAGSIYLNETKPISYNKNSEIDRELLNKYFSTQPSYSSMIYDSYREVYYRIADISISEDKYDPGRKSGYVKPFSILVLDSKFNLIGETVLPHLSHSRVEFFVSKEGLNMKKYQEDEEDLLIFSTFLPKPLN